MSPLEALENQIRAVFSDNEDLRRALRALPDGDDIVDALPSVQVPRLEFIHQLVRLCDARGLLPVLQDIARAGSSRDAETTTAIRIRHPLQPAPQFFGREDILAALRVWWSTRNAVTIHTIIGPGGCGKTALVERFIRSLRDTTTDLALYVWSFYEDTDCQTFLDDVTQWEGSVGASQPRLIVLDGLENIQATGNGGDVRGSLSGSARSVRHLLQRIAAGEDTSRLLVTSRFSLTDLEPWRAAIHEISLEDLPGSDGIALLTALGVHGDDALLAELVDQTGGHALTTMAWGTYIATYREGRPDEHMIIPLAEAAVGDRYPSKLKRVLLEHAKAMSRSERRIMCALANDRDVPADPATDAVLTRLRRLGLIYQDEYTITIHPALRQFFSAIDGAELHELDDIAVQISLDLRDRPGNSGRCMRCNGAAVIENVVCACCGTDMDYPGDAFVEDRDGRLVLAVEDGRGAHHYLACESCEDCVDCDRAEGSEVECEYGPLCSYCEHMWQKLERA